MKYLFEKYLTNQRGRSFVGYQSVVADSLEDAKHAVLSKAEEGVTLAQVYIPQEEE